MTTDRLLLEDVRFYGHHGVSKAEQTVGVWFSVDAELAVDLEPAVVSDDLAAAVDYGVVARRIVDIGTQGRVNLIDVRRLGLIPYAENDYTRNVFPLKLFEYLALGRAVIAPSRPFPPLPATRASRSPRSTPPFCPLA